MQTWCIYIYIYLYLFMFILFKIVWRENEPEWGVKAKNVISDCSLSNFHDLIGAVSRFMLPSSHPLLSNFHAKYFFLSR
jgi:hypothetical protein